MNIREELIKMDRDTYGKYDLTNMYESVQLTEKDKDELVKYIKGYDINATNNLLQTNFNGISESIEEDDDISDMKMFVDEDLINECDKVLKESEDDVIYFPYEDIEVTKFGPTYSTYDPSFGYSPEYEEETVSIDIDLPVNKDSVEEELIEIIKPEEYPEGIYNDDDKMYEYIENNLDHFIEKYKTELSNIFKERAEEYAQENNSILGENKPTSPQRKSFNGKKGKGIKKYHKEISSKPEDKIQDCIDIFQNEIFYNEYKTEKELRDKFLSDMTEKGLDSKEQMEVLSKLDFDDSIGYVVSEETETKNEDLNESISTQIDGLAKRYNNKDGYSAVKDILYNIAGNGGNEVISKVASGYMIESLEETLVKLSDLVKDSILVYTDDIKNIDGEYVAQQYKLDDLDEEYEDYDKENKVEKFILDEEDIKKVIENIANRPIDILKRHKNKKFKTDYNLDDEDIKNILKQLSLGDYSYNIKSKNEAHLGNILTVFVTDKNFELKNKKLDNIIIYIKVDDSSEGYVTLISIHKSTKPSENKHPYKESIEDATIDDVEEFIEYSKDRFPGSEAIYDGDTNTIKITLQKEIVEEYTKKDYNNSKEFIELPTFVKAWKNLKLSEEDLRALQNLIMTSNTAIPLGGNVFKIRYSPDTLKKGKDTATRVVYIEFVKDSKIYLASAFSKSEEQNISDTELKVFKQMSRSLEG